MEPAEPSLARLPQPYRSDIDGLRALAVLAVVRYHADLPLIGGGFVGVDVFFVISGCLVGRNIADEIAAGRFRRLSRAAYTAHPGGAARRTSPGKPVRFDACTIAWLAGNEAHAGEDIPQSCVNRQKRLDNVGDSHAAQLRPTVALLAKEGVLDGRDTVFPVSAGRVPSTGMISRMGWRTARAPCGGPS